MKLIDTVSGEVIADITTNHSMSIDDILSLMKYTIDGDTGELITEDHKPAGAFYENLTIEA